jgi:hypothetical protein
VRVTVSSRPSEWRQDPACAGIDVDLFYGGITDQAQALLICQRCPVAEACLWAAMLEEAGWAGMPAVTQAARVAPCTGVTDAMCP